MATADQITRLVEILGEDEARTLIWRLIAPENEADRMLADSEMLFWLEDETDWDDGYNTEDETDETDEEQEQEPILDNNGQVITGVISIYMNDQEYMLLPNGALFQDGIQVGMMMNNGDFQLF